MDGLICGFLFKTKRILYVIVNICGFVIIIFFFQSCNFVDNYPSDWGNIVDCSRQCDSLISGNYSIYCNSTIKRMDSTKITHLIELPGLSAVKSDYDNIIMNLTNQKTLIVILRYECDTVYKTIFPDNGLEFSLTEEGLEMESITTEKRRGGDVGSIELSSGSRITLLKSSNGSLVAKYRRSSFELFLVIPLFGSFTSWYKYEKYQFSQ